jgi:hypothetical protein
MKDPFALLGMEPRPWINTEALREAFNQRAAACHPDSNPESDATARFLELNAAYQTLKDPVARLRCLVELSGNIPQQEQKEITSVPQELIALFAEIAPIKADLGNFINQRSAAKSPLSLALLRHEEQKVKTGIAIIEKKLLHEWESSLSSLHTLDEHWMERSPALINSANELATRMRFLQKWMASLKLDSLPNAHLSPL